MRRFALTESQLRALRNAASGDRRLYYVKVGWFADIIGRRVQATTVHALDRRGLLEPIVPRQGIRVRDRRLTILADGYLNEDH